MEASVPVRSDSPSVGRSVQSELDPRARRAVRSSADDRTLAGAPTNARSDTPIRLGREVRLGTSPLRRLRSVDSKSTQPAGNQPSQNPDVPVISR